MKIVCKTQDLSEAVNTVQKAVSSKTTMQILDGILIECTEDRLTLTGNNLEIGIEFILPCSILSVGAVVVNSKLFGEIVRKLPDSEVCIQVINNKLIIDCNKSHFELTAVDPEGFPKIPHIDKEYDYKINEKILKDMIRATIFAVGTDEKKSNLMGSLLESVGNILFLVSIDGFRMALRRYENKVEMDDFSVIIPTIALNELLKIMQSEDRDVFISATNSLVSFEFGRCKLVSRIVEGEFLNYNNVVPDYHETKIRLRTKEFLVSVDRAFLSNIEDKKYPIKLNMTEDKLIITSDASIGTVKEEVPCEIVGLAMKIGFNPKYFIEALRVIEDEEIDFYFTSSSGPATIKPIKGSAYAYMFLPVRMGENNDEQSEDES